MDKLFGQDATVNKSSDDNQKYYGKDLIEENCEAEFDKNAENTLKKYRNQLYAVLNSGPQAIILIDKNYVIHEFNENAKDMIAQISGKELNKKENILEYVWGDYADKLVNSFNKALQGESVRVEESIMDTSKDILYFEIYYSPISLDNKEILGVNLIFWPITERKLNEKLLSKKIDLEKTISKISSRFIKSNNTDEMIALSLKDIGKVTGASRAYIFSYSNDKKYVSNTYEWCSKGTIPQKDKLQNIPADTIKWWGERLEKEGIVNIEDIDRLPEIASVEKNILKEQDIKSLVSLPIYIYGNIQGFIGLDNIQNNESWDNNNIYLLRVCTEIIGSALQRRKSYEKAQKFMLALRVSGIGVVITDSNTEIQYVDQNFCKLTGFKSEELIGNNFDNIRSGYHTKDYYKEMYRKLYLGEIWKDEFYNKRKDGSFYWQSTTIAPIINTNGTITNFVAVCDDITIRKKMELNIKCKNIELEKMVEQLRKTQGQLIQQEKLAGIGQLAAGVAHEINNPLGFIISNFESLKKYTLKFKTLIQNYRKFKNNISSFHQDTVMEGIRSLDNLEESYHIDFLLEDLEELFKDSKEGFDRVSNIIKSLKFFAHQDSFNTFEFYDLNLGVKNTLTIAHNEIKYNAVANENLGKLPLIEASGQEINQVLLNVILNAVYAIKEKHKNKMGEICIDTFQKDNSVYCRISDNGGGIPQKYIDKVFNPFFTTKPVGKGTGLGLSMAYESIVNKHNGKITIENTEGVGAAFLIEIPIKHNYKD